MEERKLNEQESLAIITEMINRTKRQMHIGDGNMLLLWGYVTVAVTGLVWVLLHIYRHPAIMWLFFLIWIIGGIVAPRMAKKQEAVGGKSYIDRVSGDIWKVVGYSGLGLTFSCLAFMLFGKYNSWNAMFVYPLLIVGMAECFQGIVLRIKAMMFGGGVGIFAGIVTLTMVSGGVMLRPDWYFPLFIAAFVFMLIVPGHWINHQCRKRGAAYV